MTDPGPLPDDLPSPPTYRFCPNCGTEAHP